MFGENRKTWTGLLLYLPLLLTTASCKRDSDPAPILQPMVARISPKGGVAGMPATIFGSNFNKNAASNTVSFNGVPAIVSLATDTTLIVTTPVSTTGEVEVTVDGATAGGLTFRYYDVFVVGYEPSDAGLSRIWLWRNGLLQYITDGTLSSFATALAISGEDVHIAGYYYDGINFVKRPTYWKNNMTVPLESTGEPTDIAIDGNDVYISGQQGLTAVYWKNAAIHYLSGGLNTEWGATSITIKNNEPIFGGWAHNGNYLKVATLWQNDLPLPVSDGTKSTVIKDIQFVGDNMHMMGHETHASGQSIIYWKDDASIPVTNGALMAWSGAMAIDGDDVLIAGLEVNAQGISVAKVWVNGVARPISDGTVSVDLAGIAVIDHEILLSGIVHGPNLGLAFFLINDYTFILSQNPGVSVIGMYVR